MNSTSPTSAAAWATARLVELADGSVKYDMITGIGVHHFGHGHPAVVASALDAAVRDTIMQGNLQQDVESPRLSKLLIESANRRGAKLAHCFLTSSGAMANENALKLVFQKKSPADRVLAFERCFMGRSLALSQITDSPQYRQGLPAVLAVDYVPFFDPAKERASTEAAVRTLRQQIPRHPGKHAVMCMEMVQGEGGYHPGDRDFFIAIINVLKEHKIAVHIDEVQTFGRTTELFAFQHFGLDALVDVVTIGKLCQACATLFTDEYKPRPGLMSQTFTGSTSAIMAARVIVENLLSGGFFGHDGRNTALHTRFAQRLGAIAYHHPTWLDGPFGLGTMIAFTPFDGSADTAKKVVHAMFDDGVIAFVAGHDPTRVRMLPAAPVVGDKVIDAVCRIIEGSLARVAEKKIEPPMNADERR